MLTALVYRFSDSARQRQREKQKCFFNIADVSRDPLAPALSAAGGDALAFRSTALVEFSFGLFFCSPHSLPRVTRWRVASIRGQATHRYVGGSLTLDSLFASRLFVFREISTTIRIRTRRGTFRFCWFGRQVVVQDPNILVARISTARGKKPCACAVLLMIVLVVSLPTTTTTLAARCLCLPFPLVCCACSSRVSLLSRLSSLDPESLSIALYPEMQGYATPDIRLANSLSLSR